jgi:hypothetical protein
MDAGSRLIKEVRKMGGEFSLSFLVYTVKRTITIPGSQELMKSITGQLSIWR